MLGLLVTHRRDVVGGLVALAAIALIVANGLFMQSGPHPAPIFAIKPLPVVANEPTGAVIPRPRPAAVAETPKPEPIEDRPVPMPPRSRARSRRLPPTAIRSPTSSRSSRIR